MAVKSPLKRAQQGFILVAALWIIAIMLIAVGIFHAYVQQKVLIGIQAKAALTQTLDRVSTTQTVLYLLSSTRKTRAGMTLSDQAESQYITAEGYLISDAVGDEVTLDGTSYQGVGSALFSLQDAAGAISLNATNLDDLAQLLRRFGADPLTESQLLSRLQDYTDADDLINISGAEQRDYAAKKLPLPTNDYLRTEAELTRVMGWAQWLDEHPEVELQNWFTIKRDSVLNLNVMPKSLLVKYLNLKPDLAELLMRERKTNPFNNIDDFILRTGLPLNLSEEKYRFFPSNEMRLKVWNQGGGQAQLISLQLTPNGLFGPWLVDYEYSVQRGNDNNEAIALWQTNLFDHTLGAEREQSGTFRE